MANRVRKTGLRRFLVGRSRAQSMVELALILPIMLLLLIGALDVGRLFYYDIIVGNAVREGARRAVDMNYTNTEVETIVRGAAPEITLGSVNISPNVRSQTTPSENVLVSVSATYSMQVFTPGISALIGNPKTITHSAVMKLY